MIWFIGLFGNGIFSSTLGSSSGSGSSDISIRDGSPPIRLEQTEDQTAKAAMKNDSVKSE